MKGEMTPVDYDILMATDCRFPGGTTASVVEEIEAQHRAGYRTGLLHLPSPVQRSRRPFAERIRRVLADGKADLVVGPAPVRTSLLLIRHPTVLTRKPAVMPPIEADHLVMIANQVPEDERGAEPYYDPAQVHQTITATFGTEAVWAPIGPAVRAALAPSQVPMLAGDWENIIDTGVWATQRTGFVSDRPVIGRHSRGHWSKWPATRADILAAYPPDPRYQVRILGGTEAPEGILGHLPANWETLPFDSVPVAEFLAGIDFLVYYHHPGLVEAFGRVVLEGLATGAVCVVPRELEPIFGDACHYGTPAGVREFVDSLVADPEEFLRRSRRGVDLVRKRFSYEAHLARVADVIGPPSQDSGDRTEHIEHVGPEPTATLLPTVTVLLHTSDAPRPDLGDLPVLEPREHVVVLTDQPDDEWPEHVLVESIPQAMATQTAPARQADLRRRLAHVARAHRAKRVLLWDPGQVALTTGLDSDVQVHLHAPARGTASTITPARPRSSPQALAQRVGRQGMSLARRRAPRVVRRVGRTVVDTAGRVRRGVSGFAGAQNPTAVPVPAIYPHLDPRAPVVLAVVTSAEMVPGTTLDALLGRAQESSAFRLAVIAPADWGPAARDRGVTLETLIGEQNWPRTYTARWPEYARERVREVTRLIRPVAVVTIDRTIDPQEDPAGARVLDVIEAAARARQ